MSPYFSVDGLLDKNCKQSDFGNSDHVIQLPKSSSQSTRIKLGQLLMLQTLILICNRLLHLLGFKYQSNYDEPTMSDMDSPVSLSLKKK